MSKLIAKIAPLARAYGGPSTVARLGRQTMALAGLMALSASAHGVTCGGGVQTACWTQVTPTFPPGSPTPAGGPSNMALLMDGRVLFSGIETSTSWWTLKPASDGGYANGTFTAVGSSAVGRIFNPSFVLRDGKYWECGGEFLSTDSPPPPPI